MFLVGFYTRGIVEVWKYGLNAHTRGMFLAASFFLLSIFATSDENNTSSIEGGSTVRDNLLIHQYFLLIVELPCQLMILGQS